MRFPQVAVMPVGNTRCLHPVLSACAMIAIRTPGHVVQVRMFERSCFDQ